MPTTDIPSRARTHRVRARDDQPIVQQGGGPHTRAGTALGFRTCAASGSFGPRRSAALRSAREGASSRPRERGSSLLPVMLLMFLFSAVAFGAAIVIRVEIAIAERFRQAAEAFYAAEAGLAAVLADLRTLPDWTPVLDGSRQSPLSDGAFAGSKAVPRGGSVLVCCGASSAAGRLAADTALSPLPARRAVQWRPFLWAPLQSLAPAHPASRLLIIVWVADDEGDADGDPARDANGLLLVRSEAIEPGGVRRIVEAYADRRLPRAPIDDESPPDAPIFGPPAVGALGWREIR